MDRHLIRTVQAAQNAMKLRLVGKSVTPAGFSGARACGGHEWKPRECCWPEGDRTPYTFCCEPCYPGKSYCLEHCKRAYTNFHDPSVQEAAK